MATRLRLSQVDFAAAVALHLVAAAEAEAAPAAARLPPVAAAVVAEDIKPNLTLL